MMSSNMFDKVTVGGLDSLLGCSLRTGICFCTVYAMVLVIGLTSFLHLRFGIGIN
jgi:hypothetical protein